MAQSPKKPSKQHRFGKLKRFNKLVQDDKDNPQSLIPLAEARYMPRCDFCNARPVEWYYPAQDFKFGVRSDSDSEKIDYLRDWAACNTCYMAIEIGDREGLTLGAVLSHIEIWKKLPRGWTRQLLFRRIRELHDIFFKNRLGAPVRAQKVASE